MRIILGLGNPGDAYRGTRHNVGFETIDKLSHELGIKLKNNRRFRALAGEGRMGMTPVLLAKPQTYMNLSGYTAQAVLAYYKLPPSALIVVYDDVSLPVGDIRVRERGSAGGQKGMADIIARLGTDEFPRVRIGIGSKPESWDLADYVLSRFGKNETDAIAQAVARAGDAVGFILKEDTAAAMNEFNRKITPVTEPRKRKPLAEILATAQENDTWDGTPAEITTEEREWLDTPSVGAEVVQYD